MVAKLVRQMIDSEHDLEFRRGPVDVLELMHEETWHGVDVALVDLLLPGETGDTLISWLRSHAPHVRRIAMSGAGERRLAQAAADADVTLLKPFMVDDLLAAIRAKH